MDLSKIKKALRNKYYLSATILIVALSVDQWSKWMIRSHLRLGESIPLIDPIFALLYTQNRGAAFSLLNSAPAAFRDPFFLLVPVVAVSILSVMLVKLPSDDRYSVVALTLILAGAIGNFIDRVSLGFVVDFFDVHWRDVYHYPIFNVADSCICIGVGLLFLQSFRSRKTARSAT